MRSANDLHTRGVQPGAAGDQPAEGVICLTVDRWCTHAHHEHAATQADDLVAPRAWLEGNLDVRIRAQYLSD